MARATDVFEASPAYLHQAHLPGEQFLGRFTRLAADLQDKQYQCYIDMDMLATLDKGEELYFELYKIVGVPRPCVPYQPARRILVERASEKLAVPERVKFWDGAAREVAKDEARKARAAAAARRRAELQKHERDSKPEKKPAPASRSKDHLTKKENLRDTLMAIGDKDNGHADHFAGLLEADAAEKQEDWSWLSDDEQAEKEEEDWSFLDDGYVGSLFGQGEELDMRLSDLYDNDHGDEDVLFDDDPLFQDGVRDEESDGAASEDLFGPSDDSKGDDGPLVPSEAAAPKPAPEESRSGCRRAGGRRGACVEDLSNTDYVPEGVKLRKYEPRDGHPFWQAELPKGTKDQKGKRYRVRNWAKEGQNEGTVLMDIQEWLWNNCGVDGGAAGDAPSSSSLKDSLNIIFLRLEVVSLVHALTCLKSQAHAFAPSRRRRKSF